MEMYVSRIIKTLLGISLIVFVSLLSGCAGHLASAQRLAYLITFATDGVVDDERGEWKESGSNNSVKSLYIKSYRFDRDNRQKPHLYMSYLEKMTPAGQAESYVYYDSLGNVFKKGARSFNDQGQLVADIDYAADDELLGKMIISYDGGGKQQERRFFDDKGFLYSLSFEMNEQGKIKEASISVQGKTETYKYKYTPKDSLESISNENRDGIFFEYDTAGNNTEKYLIHGSHMYYWDSSEYDSKNQMVAFTYTNELSRKKGSVSFQYDKEGNRIEVVDGPYVTKRKYQGKKVILEEAFDQYGRLQERIQTQLDTLGNPTKREVFHFDEDQNKLLPYMLFEYTHEFY